MISNSEKCKRSECFIKVTVKAFWKVARLYLYNILYGVF